MGAPTRTEPNDTVEEATDLYFDTNPLPDSLDATDTDDWYRILDLVGDTADNQLDAQEYSIGLKRTSGANVKGILMEPNGLELGEIYSDGGLEELLFIVPRDGDYFLWITSDPKGSSASYEIYQGGAKDVDNRQYHDKNNVPPGVGFSESVNVANSLNPSKDLVDYFHMTIPPFRSLEATMTFQGDLTFHLQVLNDTYGVLADLGSGESYTISNNNDVSTDAIFRVFIYLSTRGTYPSSSKSYNLELFLWSHLTKPEVNPSDPWTMARTSEDTPLFPNINLTKHFMESNGDPLEFALVSVPEHLDVTFINTTNIAKVVISVEVRVVPEPNWYGDEVLTFQASDRDASIADNITINVTSVNDLPYILKIGAADYGGGTFNMFAYEDEPRSYTVTYMDDDDPLSLIFFTSNETLDFVEVNPDNGTITIDASQSDVGNYWFSLQMSDTHDTVEVDIFLDVQAVNDAPPEPTIQITGVEPTSVLPGEEVLVEAIVGPDPDGDVLTFKWEWGDGTTGQGRESSHIYGEGIYGNRTIKLTVSDGLLSSTAIVRIFLEKPEDLVKGTLFRSYPEDPADVVKFSESWRKSIPDDERKFEVEKVEEMGVDITSLEYQRRGNNLEVILSVKDSIQIDGSFRYYLYVMRPGYTEPFVDFQNLTSWAQIPDRSPLGEQIIAYREYVGDPVLHNTSKGTITNQRSLVWIIPFIELVEGGLSFPIDPANFTLFAVTEHILDYGESKGISERYIMTDTAGEGATKVGEIKTGGSTGGGGGSNLADISTSTKIGVVVALVVLIAVIGIASFYFVRKQSKEKKKEEEEFIQHVKKMREEGKDLFGKEVEVEGSKQVSYEDLYGNAPPPDHDVKGSGVPGATLPSAGLGTPIDAGSHIMEQNISGDEQEK